MPKLKGPAEGKVVIAKFDGKSKSIFASLKQTKNLVLLSPVVNRFCAGEYLGAIIEHVIVAYGFTTFLIVDEVGWHNLKDREFSSEKESQLRANARELGAQYFELNLAHFLKPLNIELDKFNDTYQNKKTSEKIAILNKLYSSNDLKIQVIFWQDWVNNSLHTFNEKKAEIYDQYRSVDSLMSAVESAAKVYVKRNSSDDADAKEFNHRLNISKEYFTEECPGVVWIAAALEYNFITYAGDMNDAFKATINLFVVGEDINTEKNHFFIKVKQPEYLVNWLHINFRREYSASQKRFLLPNPYSLFSPAAIPLSVEHIKVMVVTILEYSDMDMNAKAELLVALFIRLARLNPAPTISGPNNEPSTGHNP